MFTGDESMRQHRENNLTPSNRNSVFNFPYVTLNEKQPLNSPQHPSPYFSSNSSKPTNKAIKVICDGGCTEELLLPQSDADNLRNLNGPGGFSIKVANKAVITSVASGPVRINDKIQVQAHVFKDSDLDKPLLGLSPLTNAGHNIMLHKHGMNILRDGEIILSSTKGASEKLWSLEIPIDTDPDLPTVLLAVRNDNDFERAKYLSACFFNAADSTILTALRTGILKHHLISADAFAKNIPNSAESAKGHLDKTRNNQRSTRVHKQAPKHIEPTQTSKSGETFKETPEDAEGMGKFLYCKILPWDEAEETEHPRDQAQYSDLSGRMPVSGYSGYNYILISVYKNYIHYTPMKDRSAKEYVKAFQSTIQYFSKRNGCPPLIIIDNETSTALETYLTEDAKVDYQYVPPNDHSANKAERAMRTSKNHLIGGLAGCPATFPAYLWDQLLVQAEITLNHLRVWDDDRMINAYEGLHKIPYDFLAHPIAPPGIQVEIHNPSTVRGTWESHSMSGYYLGPSPHSYRSWEVYVSKTRKIRTTNCVAWISNRVQMPGSSKAEMLLASIADMNNSLRSLADTITPTDKQSFHDHTATAVAALRFLHGIYSQGQTEPAEVQRVPRLGTEDIPGPPAVQRVQAPQVKQAAPPTIPESDEHPYPPNDPPTKQRQRGKRTTTPQRRSRRLASIRKECATNFAIDPLPLDDELPYAFFTQATQPRPYEGPPLDTLNLDQQGKPLKYNTALKDPSRSARFVIASSTEWRKHLTERKTMHPIYKHDQPQDRRGDTTYYNQVTKEKIIDGTYSARVRGTIDGSKTNYTGDKSSHVSNLATVKLLLNSVASTPNASFITLDIVDFFLNHDLDRPEYIKVPLKSIPADICTENSLVKYADDKGNILFEVVKAVYGLPQSNLISQRCVTKLLRENDYLECDNSPGLYTHTSRPIAFTLVVDDFGVKLVSKADAQHLIDVLQQQYTIKVNWAGDKYLGYTIRHDANWDEIILSMPGVIPCALKRFCPHGVPKYAASPAVYIPPVYGQKGQQQAHEDSTPKLSDKDKQFCQEVNGVFLYLALALDSTFLTACSNIATQTASPTESTLEAVHRLLGYAALYPNNELVFKKSDMILKGQSDGSYLSRPDSKSVAGGILYVGMNDDSSIIHGIIETFCKTISVVCASTGEVEYASAFTLGQRACGPQMTLRDLGHPQPATPIQVDNLFAVGLANDKIKAKHSKSIDMRFHWIRDRVRQKQFKIQWCKGSDLLADFFTKAQPVWRHKLFMPMLIRIPPNLPIK